VSGIAKVSAKIAQSLLSGRKDEAVACEVPPVRVLRNRQIRGPSLLTLSSCRRSASSREEASTFSRFVLRSHQKEMELAGIQVFEALESSTCTDLFCPEEIEPIRAHSWIGSAFE
jgi:hypothetical protein